MVLQPNGVKKMGEIQLAVRFTCSSFLKLRQTYTMNLLFPKMHHIYPLSMYQLNSLRQQATRILCSRLNRTEPPLRREVVEYILDAGSQMWSLRKGKANFERLLVTLKCFMDAWTWFDQIRRWKNPTATVVVISLYSIAVLEPDLVLPTLILNYIQVGICRWMKRPRHSTHIDVKLSLADSTTADELDEKFDKFPSSRQSNVLRMRYDRLRSIEGRVVTVLGYLATRAERFHSLLSWQEPRITAVLKFFFLLGNFIG